MGLFSRKQKVRLEEFCGDFYDKTILNPVNAGIDIGEVYFQQRLTSVAAADARFAAVDSKRFRAEMTPIHFEVFGLAWFHQLGLKHVPEQTYYTKLYLEARNKADIWDAMEPYSRAIALSGGQAANLGQSVALRRANVVGINTLRTQFFELWREQGFGPEVVARATGRLGTDVAWEKGLASRLIMLTLCERLGCEVNEEAQFRLVVVIQGLYGGAREALKAIRVVA